VSPLPGKALFSALYGICFIKIVWSCTTYVLLCRLRENLVRWQGEGCEFRR